MNDSDELVEVHDSALEKTASQESSPVRSSVKRKSPNAAEEGEGNEYLLKY